MASLPSSSLLNMLVVLTILQVPYTSSFTQFIFGDSLVDAGNNDYIITLSRADSPPYGIDFAPSGGRPTGRFTNGRTICDIIGQALGAKWFPLPYLAPSTGDGALFQGINFASGSSGILDESGTLFVGRVPLRQQVDFFEKSRAHMGRMAGDGTTKEILKKAIFSITSGSNDILDYIRPSIPFLGEDKVSPSLLHDFMISNLTIQLKRLHALGARKFIVVGVGPLGCIPFVRALNLIPNGRCVTEANELTQGYNKRLVKLLNGLNREFGPEAIFIYANSYNILIDIIRNSRDYGFENVSDPCCGGSFPPFICFKGNDEKTSSFLCKDRSKYVFWDAYHPTEAVNMVVAKKLLDGKDETVISPINVRQLCNYGL